jgi:arginase
VLDDAIVPAVDYRAPDGLQFDVVSRVLRAASATDKVVDLDFTIFNPTFDPEGSLARSRSGRHAGDRAARLARVPRRAPQGCAHPQ